jgi:hypothetical protein
VIPSGRPGCASPCVSWSGVRSSPTARCSADSQRGVVQRSPLARGSSITTVRWS